MDQLIRLDPIRHALNDRLVHVKHIQQEQIGALTGRHLSIGNSKQHRLHCPDGFTYDNAPFTGPQSIKQIVFGNCEQLRSTTIQVTLMHPFSFQVPGPLPQPPCPVSYCTGGMPSSAIGRGGHTQVEFTLNCGLSKGKPSFRPFACVQCALECCASPAHFHIWYNTAAGISLLHPGKGEHNRLMHPHESIDWYPIVKRYTTGLVHIRSVSPGKGEIHIAREVLRLLQEDGLASSYTAIGLDPLIDDPAGRCNAYAFLRGKHPQTIVLLGHIDTVATGDFGALEPFALDPGTLAAHVDQLAAIAPGLAQDLAAHPRERTVWNSPSSCLPRPTKKTNPPGCCKLSSFSCACANTTAWSTSALSTPTTLPRTIPATHTAISTPAPSASSCPLSSSSASPRMLATLSTASTPTCSQRNSLATSA